MHVLVQKTKRNQDRQMSRTLTEVHKAILRDVIYPCLIVGKRLRFKTDGTKELRVYE